MSYKGKVNLMSLEWRLRKVMADKGIWTGSELGRLMKEIAGYSLSAASISALMNEEPKQVKAETMDALCTALECTPSDLWKHKPTYIKKELKQTENKMEKVANDSRFPPI